MKIKLQLTTWLKRYANGNNEITVDVADCASIDDCLHLVGIPIEEVGFITLKGVRFARDAELHEGDVIRLFTTIIGG